MDKTKQRVSKIVAMPKNARQQVGRAAWVCALLLCSGSTLAFADADKAGEELGSGLGLGGAYLFGLSAGLLMFGVRYALDVRKAHLAEYGKD
jgi:hypothetical protein